MPAGNESVVRAAYEAYARGDVAGVLEFVDPGLEWTYLNPMEENPAPQTCYGRDELARGIRRQAALRLLPQLEEITARGDKVLVVVHIPGIDALRARRAVGGVMVNSTADRHHAGHVFCLRLRQ